MTNKFKALAVLIASIIFSIAAYAGPDDDADQKKSDNSAVVDAQPGPRQLKTAAPYFMEENRMLGHRLDSIGKTPFNELTKLQQAQLSEFGQAYGKLPQLDSTLTSFEKYYFNQQPKELQMSSQYQIDLYSFQLAIFTKYLHRLSVEKYARHFLTLNQRRYLEILSIRLEIIVNSFALDIIPIMEQTERSTPERPEYREVTDPIDVKFRQDTVKRQDHLMSRLSTLNRVEARFQSDLDSAYEIQRKRYAPEAIAKRAARLAKKTSIMSASPGLSGVGPFVKKLVGIDRSMI